MKPYDLNDTWLEAYLDGDLAPEAEALADSLLAEDDGWRAELGLARQIRDELRALPLPPCPPRVTHAVLAEARRRHRAGRLGRWTASLQNAWAGLLRPALATASLVAVVVAAALVGRPQPPAPQIAQAEVDQALDEAKWALAYLSNLGRETGETVRDDVLGRGVVRPMQHAVKALQD